MLYAPRNVSQTTAHASWIMQQFVWSTYVPLINREPCSFRLCGGWYACVSLVRTHPMPRFLVYRPARMREQNVIKAAVVPPTELLGMGEIIWVCKPSSLGAGLQVGGAAGRTRFRVDACTRAKIDGM